METKFTRRDFCKGSIVVALGAMGAGALSACSGAGATASPEAAAGGAETTGASQAVTLHRGYGAAHGEKSFTRVVVATTDDGTVLAANVDEFQFMAADTAGLKPVPKSDGGFGAGYAEGVALISKLANDEVYSAGIKERGGATQTWATSMAAIEAYCVGKKASELTITSVDAVSGATLVDAPNYVKLISQVAGDSALVAKGTYTGDGADLKLGVATAAPHGEKAFADAVSLVQGDVLVATSIDEFQFMAADKAGIIAVPKSDSGLGQGYAEGVVLASKSVNNEEYSAGIKEKAQATTTWLASIEAIEAAVAGQKISDIKVSGPDAVSGATLVDTAAYAEVAVAAAKAA